MADGADLALVLGVGLVMAVGVVGTILPFLPGVPIVWGGGLIFGLVAGFGRVGIAAFAAMTVLAVGGVLAGVALPARRGTASGAPRSTLLAGAFGAVVGFFVVPVLGIVVGGAAGVFLAEYARLGDTAAALATTKAVVVGFGIGALVELAAAVLMVVTWVVWVVAA